MSNTNPIEVTAEIELLRGRFLVSHQIRAEVIEDDGHGSASELCLVWLDKVHIDDIGMDAEEYIGAVEAIEAEYTRIVGRRTYARFVKTVGVVADQQVSA